MTEAVVFNPPNPAVQSPKAALIEWLVAEGERVAVGTPLCNYEIDKAVVIFSSPADGFVRRLLVSEGGRFAPGDVLALITSEIDGPLPASPVTHYREDEGDSDFDWSEIDNRGGDPEPLGVMRKAIAQRMAMSKRHIPCFYLTVVVDMTACLEKRREMRKTGLKATINDMAVKAAALTLVKHPKVAGVFTPQGVVPRGDFNIGFAAALPDEGLVVPVIKRADRKSLHQIAAETRELAAKAKRGELVPEDCAGGVFSVSYLGGSDVDNFVAIVNPGEAAIAAVGKTVETPVVIDGQVVIRPMAKITLSSDHRSIDGALAARFMSDMKHQLEHADEL